MTHATLLTHRDDNILTITINRPEKLNAITPTMLAELKACLDDTAKDESLSVVILKSAGRVFCAGYDLNEENWITSQYPANHPDGVEIEQDKKDIIALLDYWLDMWRFPKPIIAQVQGAALSGAGEMLAACDIVIASDKASFGHPAGRDLGIPPTVFFWPQLIGMRKTKEMLYTARSMSAAEAETLGLINNCVPADDLEDRVTVLARDIAKTPVNHLMILKQATQNFYDTKDMRSAGKDAAILDAEFHQSPTFLAFFKLVREKGMKAALTERARLFG